MYHDVSEFRNFYYHSRLGRSVQRRIQLELVEVLKNTHQHPAQNVLVGYGFAAPFLRPFRRHFQNVVNLMPEAQGVMAWPPNEQNISVMAMDGLWPIGANSADVILVAHALECTDDLTVLLNEIWRVGAPEGKVIFVVSNRMGIWANSDATPFGYGRPFSHGQLTKILKSHGFDVHQISGALYAPPMTSRMGLKSMAAIEWLLGAKSRKLFAGVLILEATKHIGIRPPMLRSKAPIFANPSMVPLYNNRQKTNVELMRE